MIDWSVSLILVDAAGVMLDAGGVMLDAAGLVVDAAGAMVDPAGAVVDPAGVAVWLHPTQAISIAVTRIMRLSRCMRNLRVADVALLGNEVPVAHGGGTLAP
jgi:hypothetical protein